MKCENIILTVTLLWCSPKVIGHFSKDWTDESSMGGHSWFSDSSEPGYKNNSPEMHGAPNWYNSDMSNISPHSDSSELNSGHSHHRPSHEHEWHPHPSFSHENEWHPHPSFSHENEWHPYPWPSHKRERHPHPSFSHENEWHPYHVSTESNNKYQTIATENIKPKIQSKTTTESSQKKKVATNTKSTVESKTESTTSPVTLGTVTVTTSEVQIQNCILNCPVTSEYNPVCGTNLITYTNPGRLNCAKQCGLGVELLTYSRCSQNVPSTTTTSTSSTTTAQPSIELTTVSRLFSECTKSCDSSNEWRPVCGSNGVTYKNAQYLMCVQFCGVDVRLVRFEACPTAKVSTTSTTPKIVETVTPTGSIKIKLQKKIQFCVKGCPVTSEDNPVCGTDDVTYKNPSALQCLIICEIKVQLKYPSACVNKNGNNNIQQVTSTTSIPDQVTMPLPDQVEMCFNNCPIVSDDKPICGTNGVTYKNRGELQCAKTCGVKVEIKHIQACPPEISGTTTRRIEITAPKPVETTTVTNIPVTQNCVDSCRNNLGYKPVCGSNDLTYDNIEHLQCVQSCSVDVSLVTYYACDNTIVVPSVTTEKQTENNLPTNSPVIETNPDGNLKAEIDGLFNIRTTSVANVNLIDPRFNSPNQ